MVRITWLHLSDLHFTSPPDPDQERVLQALLKDVEKMASGREIVLSKQSKFSFKPDIVLVSGDIAHSGQEEQYVRCEQFLKEIWKKVGMTKKRGARRTFVVPGNHDIRRKKPAGSEKHGYSIAQHKLLSEEKTPKEFHDTLKMIWEEDRKVIFEKFEEYQKFVLRFSGERHPIFGHETPSFSILVPFEDIDVGGKFEVEIAGVCSPWIGGRDIEDGTLVVGPYQIDEIDTKRKQEKWKNAVLRIVMMHHPFRAIHDFDVASTSERLCKMFDCLLFGHLHREYFHQEVTPDYSAFHFSAGACYAHPFLKNSYNIVQVLATEKKEIQGMNICTRVYRRDGNEFVGDYSRHSGPGEGIVVISRDCLALHNRIRNGL